MAGNKKPSRKASKHKPGTNAHLFDGLARAKKAKHKRYDQMNEKVRRLNNTLMGDPVNQHKIDKTFGPLERVLEEQARTGTNLVDEEGDVVMHDPEEGWVKIVPGILHMCFVFEHIARARVWPAMPPGLRVYALGLQIGRTIDQDDIDKSRETLAWMRKHIATLTPTKWTELLEWAIELGEKDEKNHAA